MVLTINQKFDCYICQPVLIPTLPPSTPPPLAPNPKTRSCDRTGSLPKGANLVDRKKRIPEMLNPTFLGYLDQAFHLILIMQNE